MDEQLLAEALSGHSTPLIRTDFTNNPAWRAVITELSKPIDFDRPDNPDPGEEAYRANLLPIDDRSFEGITAADLGRMFTATDDSFGYVILADSRAMAEALSGGELTVEYVDLSLSDPEDAELFDSYMGRAFRVAAPEIASIETNLSIANLDFSDFADATDPDGVFRGFGDA